MEASRILWVRATFGKGLYKIQGRADRWTFFCSRGHAWLNAAAGIWSTGSMRPSRITATIEVCLYPGGKVLLTEPLVVGLVHPPTRFSTQSSNASVTFIDATTRGDGPIIRSYVVTCHESFDESFKCRDAEALDNGGPSCGTLIAAKVSGLPSGCEVFVTTHDLPGESSSRRQQIRATPPCQGLQRAWFCHRSA